MTTNTGVRIGHLVTIMFLMSGAFVLARTGRDALFFQDDGIRALPIAYAGMAALALPTAAAVLWMIRAVGRQRARIVSIGAMTGVLAVAGAYGTTGGGAVMTAFFALVPVAFGALFSLAWLMAGEVQAAGTARQAVAFGRAGGASIAGGLVGAVVGRLAAAWLDAGGVLLLAAVVLGASGVAAWMAPDRPASSIGPHHHEAIVRRPAFATAMTQDYVRVLLAIGAVAAFCGVLIEFQFYLAMSSAAGSGAGATARFAEFYLVLNLVGLAIQQFVVPRLHATVGVAGALMLLPGAIAALVPFTMGMGALVPQAALRVAEGGLKASVHRVSWEQAFLPIARACRTEARLLVDGMGTRMAEGLAAAVLYAWLTTGSARATQAQLPVMILLASAVWLGLTGWAGRLTIRGAVADGHGYLARMPDA